MDRHEEYELYGGMKRLAACPHEKIFGVYEKLAFESRLRGQHMPPQAKALFAEILSGLPSFRKFNPYHDDRGRFTFSPNGPSDDNKPDDSSGTGTPAPKPTDGSIKPVADAQPPTSRDPDAIPVTLNNGATVINPVNSKPLLMPKGVSLQDNAGIGQQLSQLPSFFSGDVSIAREESMIRLMENNGTMDYQRIYSDNGQPNKTYIDFGNYNYGVVTAAAGYTLNEALFAAGVHNVYGGNDDTSGSYFTDASENTFIPLGFHAYTAGLILPKN